MAKGRTPPNKVTSRDVARAANVSQALVSRAFTGNGRIAEETRERILKVAAEIGWQPNALAASMVTGDAPLVSVITTRLSFDWRAQVLSHLLKAFGERHLQPLLFYADTDEEVDRLLGETISWRTRGVVVTAGVITEARAEAILSRGQFLAALNRPANHAEAFATATDNPSGGALAADVLYGEGRRRYLVLAGQRDSWASNRRIEGFVAGASAKGITAEVWYNHTMSPEAGFACAHRLLALAPSERPDGVFSTNDALALGFMDGLRGSAISIPADLGLIGFDNLPASSWTPYQLTTFEQPLDAMVEGVLAHIEHHQLRRREPELAAPIPVGPVSADGIVYCPPRLVIRNTTRGIK
jgi:DNA-binding LacI/PurR family transcriptional regulator